MTTKDFVKKYYPFAANTQNKTGISAILILAQAIIESGHGKSAPGNMFFGIKDTDGVNGNEQLVTTTEYSTRFDLKFPVIISVKPVIMNGKKMFKYTIKDYFRKYKTPEDSFTDHARFMLNQPRYKPALIFKTDPVALARGLFKAGYATDPNYLTLLLSVIAGVKKNLPIKT